MTLFLFAAGLIIYGCYGLFGLCFLLGATALSFALGLLTPRCRFAPLLGAIVTAGLLVFVKFQPLMGRDLIAVLGISYFSLRIISYLVDLYRGKYPPEENFIRYGLYVTYLPSIFLGPIDRYDRFRLSAMEDRRISWDGISQGAARMLLGAFKKLLIASRAGLVVGTISAATEQYRGAYALLAMVLYSVQLYADFSGGIDMVLGLSQMLGIRLTENFNAPYFSQSVAEFWRRWHMSLGSWLRDYVYIPLGGNRRGSFRKLLNTVLTFLVSGLWHGVHYLLWGLLNGLFVCVGERLKSPWKALNQLGTFLVISFLWAFFVWPETLTALKMIGSVFTVFNYGSLLASILELGLNIGEWIVLLAALGLLWVCDLKKEQLGRFYLGLSPAGRTAVLCTAALVVLIFGMYGIGFNAEEFIYSKF